MKEYVTPWLMIHQWQDTADIITESDPNDNDFSDIEDWGD